LLGGENPNPKFG
jgi:hypothetical protein